MLDLIVVITLVIAVIQGLRKGIIVAAFSLAGLLIGLAAALKLSAVTASYLSDTVNVSARWLPVLAFLLVFILAVVLVRILAAIIQKSLEAVLHGWVNRIGGMIAYCAIYLLVLSVVFFYADRLGLISSAAIAESQTFGYISPLGPKTIEAVGKLIPFFKDVFAQLSAFFQRISEAHPVNWGRFG